MLSDRALARAQGIADYPEGDPRKQENPKGSNWGHPVQDYLASVGIYFPASWCMAFMYWCFDDAAHQLGLTNPMAKIGGVLAQWNLSKADQYKGSMPQVGDVFIMDLGHGLGHTGIVEKVNPDGSLATIEGNTNDTGSREGYEVCRKTRHLGTTIIGFLRF